MNQWPTEQKALAKAMFGRPARVLLAAWIIERESQPFYQQEATLALATGYSESPSALAQELSRFADWGLVARLEPGGSERKVWYHVDKEHRAWPMLEQAAISFGLLGASGHDDGSG